MAMATTVDNTFFILGGFVSSHAAAQEVVDINGTDNFPLKGIVAWNMTSDKWTNSSMPDHLVQPNGLNGMLASVPTFGEVGLLLATGTGLVDDAPPDFKNITIYEPSEKTWHYQNATGDIPIGRDGPCTVGVQGDNGTFEV